MRHIVNKSNFIFFLLLAGLCITSSVNAKQPKHKTNSSASSETDSSKLAQQQELLAWIQNELNGKPIIDKTNWERTDNYAKRAIYMNTKTIQYIKILDECHIQLDSTYKLTTRSIDSFFDPEQYDLNRDETSRDEGSNPTNVIDLGQLNVPKLGVLDAKDQLFKEPGATTTVEITTFDVAYFRTQTSDQADKLIQVLTAASTYCKKQ